MLDCRVDCVSPYAAPECSRHHRLPVGGATSNSGFVDALALWPHSTRTRYRCVSALALRAGFQALPRGGAESDFSALKAYIASKDHYY